MPQFEMLTVIKDINFEVIERKYEPNFEYESFDKLLQDLLTLWPQEIMANRTTFVRPFNREEALKSLSIKTRNHPEVLLGMYLDPTQSGVILRMDVSKRRSITNFIGG